MPKYVIERDIPGAGKLTEGERRDVAGKSCNVGDELRDGIPAFYALHVWAWKQNPHGAFVDWNPNVSCEHYTDALAASAGH